MVAAICLFASVNASMAFLSSGCGTSCSRVSGALNAAKRGIQQKSVSSYNAASHLVC